MAKNALSNSFENKILLNTFQEVDTRSQNNRRIRMSIRNVFGLQLSWYWNSFLSQYYLAFVACLTVCKMCSTVLFLEIGERGFMTTFLWLRKWRVLEFKWLAPDCHNSAFLLAESTGLWLRLSVASLDWQGASDTLACRTALLGSGDAACSGHMPSECFISKRSEQVSVSRHSD